MADNLGLLADWERKGLFHGVQATWGAAKPTGASLIQIRETSGAMAEGWGPRIVAPASRGGHGLPYPVTEEYSKGRPFGTLSATAPATQLLLRDLLVCLWPNWTDAGTDLTLAHLTDPEFSKYMYFLTALTRDDGGDFSCYDLESAVPTQVDITVPQAGESDIVQVGFSAVGRAADELATIPSVTGAVLDTGSYLGAHDIIWKFNTAPFRVLEGRLTLGNLATLDPEGGSALAPGAHVGGMSASGSLTAWCKPSEAADVLRTAYEGETVVNMRVEFGGTAFYLDIPIRVLRCGKPNVVANAYALPIEWEMVGTADGTTDVPTASWTESVGGSAVCPYV